MEPATRASLAQGVAASSIATAISRLSGFVRVVVVAGAMGTTFLANTYQTANTIPNIVFELLAAGVLTSVFVPTFVQYLAAQRKQEGWEAANALGSVALVGLIALSALLALLARPVMFLLTIGVEDTALRTSEVNLGTTFLRLFAPQVALYGAGMIMTGALHAHRRFVLAAAAPILNNVVVIAVYLTFALMGGGETPSVGGITTGQTLVLGIGTTLGVAAMTLALVPSLLRIGWRPRWLFRPQHEAVKQAARLGVWALGYAGGYQAGLIVVLLLANRVEGGVAAYQWAYTFFYVPHALFGVPIFNVLFTAMSEQVALKRDTELIETMRDGLAMLAFILVPVSAGLIALSGPLSTVTLEYGVMSGAGAALVARVLLAFAIGLPSYSAFLVLTRAFYARGDTKTPAIVNAITVGLSSAMGATLFVLLPEMWKVAGLALGHSAAFIAGTILLARVFTTRAGAFGRTRLNASLRRIVVAGLAALGTMLFVTSMLSSGDRIGALLDLVISGAVGLLVYVGAAAGLKAPELKRLAAVTRFAR
jgi:putative peptidoglycan lipid II flippase